MALRPLEIGDKTLENQIVAELHNLLAQRRRIFAGPDESESNLNSDSFKSSVEEKSEEIARRLASLNYSVRRFSPTSEVYKLSLWKYMQLVAFFTDNGQGELDADEARTLFSIASASPNMGIKYLFQCMVEEKPFVWRHGGGRKSLSRMSRHVFTDDFDISAHFGNGRNHSVVVNFSASPQKLHTAETTPFDLDADYNIFDTREEAPTPLKWRIPPSEILVGGRDIRSLSLNLLRPPTTPYDNETGIFQFILSDDKTLTPFFRTAKDKAEFISKGIRDIRENINIHGLVKEKIDELFSVIFLPEAAEALALALAIEIDAADTLDQENRRLYLSWIFGGKSLGQPDIEGALGRYNNQYKLFQGSLNTLRQEEPPPFNIPVKNMRRLTLAMRQDIVAIAGMFEQAAKRTGVLSCNEAYNSCPFNSDFSQIAKMAAVNSILPTNLLPNNQDPSSIIKKWEDEESDKTLSNESPLPTWDERHLGQLLETMLSDPQRQLGRFRTRQTLVKTALEDALPMDDRFFAKEHSAGSIGGMLGILGMIVYDASAPAPFKIPSKESLPVKVGRSFGNTLLQAAALTITFISPMENWETAGDVYDHQLPSLILQFIRTQVELTYFELSKEERELEDALFYDRPEEQKTLLQRRLRLIKSMGRLINVETGATDR